MAAEQLDRLGARQNAEWIWGVLAELEAAGLILLADKGHQGAAHAKIPMPGLSTGTFAITQDNP